MQKLQSLINIIHKNFYIEIISSDYVFDKAAFSLQYRGQFSAEEIQIIIEQIEATKKANHKLPTWKKNDCFFSKKSFEQSTNEEVAKYKSSFYKGEILLSLCGGLGVDDWAFCQNFTTVIGVDLDAELNEIVRYNSEKLKLKNYQRIDANVEDFIAKNNENFNIIYIDPDRRDEEKRNFSLADYQPNIFELKNNLFKFTETVLIKVSPMADLEEIKKLGNILSIHAISFQHELKEILITLQKGFEEEITWIASDFTNDFGWKKTSSTKNNSEENFASIESFLAEMKYMGIPSPSITKLGLSAHYAAEINYNFSDKNCLLFAGNMPKFSSLHRTFEVQYSSVFKKSIFTKYLKEKNIGKANIIVKNYRLKPEEISKQFKIKDGGENTFIFFQIQKTAYFAHVKLIKN